MTGRIKTVKYVFIINPKAGPKNSEETIKKEAARAASVSQKRTGITYEYEFYTTKTALDATEFVRRYLDEHSEEVCFVACGGDGTLFEVTQAVMGHDNAYLTVYPCGSGNDYVKYYGGKNHFLDLTGIFEGSVRDVDVMRFEDHYSINILNFGFDTAVVETMQKVRRTPVIGGSNSYYTGIATALMKAMKNRCKVYADGELLNPDGMLLLCTLGNGAYVGGSFNCSPKSDNDDGLMEVCLVKPINIFRFLKLLPHYQNGTHLDCPHFKDIMVYRRAKSVKIEAYDGFNLCFDGELINAREATVENLERALHFIVPRDSMVTPAKMPALVK